MRRDKNAPRLYELLGDNPPSQESIRRPRPVRADPRPPKSGESSPARTLRDLFAPGRTIQIPAGWAFFALAFLLLALILGYFAGYTKRGLEYRRQAERQAALDTPSNNQGVIRDPLADPDFRSGIATGSNPPAVGRDLTPPNSGGTRSGANDGSGAIILEAGDPDPREPGLNYMVVARLPPDFATKAARYLTARGVPALRLAPDNKNWCKVVALTGFDAEALRGQEAEKLRDRVLTIGRDFKSIERGGDDFSSMYPEKFTGP